MPGRSAFPAGGSSRATGGPSIRRWRETEEEIGLDRTHIEVMGRLDIYETVTGFSITPVVGIVDEGFSLRIDGAEVREAFEVPLDFVLDPANHQRHSREYGGARRYYDAMPYRDRYIWGATAGMLVNLRRRLSRR